jgi:hypothetical protein
LPVPLKVSFAYALLKFNSPTTVSCYQRDLVTREPEPLKTIPIYVKRQITAETPLVKVYHVKPSFKTSLLTASLPFSIAPNSS